MFRQGDRPDYAYVILYGTTVFLKVNSDTYQAGKEPPPTPTTIKKSEDGKGSLDPA
jgi:hypothetical protein